MTDRELYELAVKAAEKSYSPYSDFTVGAALLCENGKVYCGCNIENAAYSPTVCAERTAFFKAVSEGERSFRAIAVAGGKDGKFSNLCAPCGVCRQVMSEFCNAETFRIILGKDSGETCSFLLKELLPGAFSLSD